MEKDKITAVGVVKQSFKEHNLQRCVALALLCKGNALVTVNNTIVHNGLKRGEDWTLRMTATTKPTSSDAVLATAENVLLQTTEALERWECEVR